MAVGEIVKPLSEITACVIDHGLAVSFAERLARPGGFGRVLYFKHWQEFFPLPLNAKIGTGFPGVERVKKLFDVIDEVDLFIFLGVGMGDLAEYLRKQGKSVWGPGRGEELELYRWDARTLHGKLGLPMQDAKLILGLDNLRRYLKENEVVFVKVSEMRGINETWESINYPLSKARLDFMERDLGPLADEQEFIVEKKIPTKIEVGIDAYNIDGKWPAHVITGIEKKDCGYLSVKVPYVDLPDSVKTCSNAIAQALKIYKFRGNYHSEIRVDKDGKPNLIDETLRIGSPPGELMQEQINNWPEIFRQGADGNLVDIEVDAERLYGFSFVLYSEFAADEWLGVEYPKEIAHNVKLYNSLRRKGIDWVVPNEDKLIAVGAVTGFGRDINTAILNAKENAEQVKGDKLEVKTDLIPQMLDLLRENKKNGITFGDSEIPDSV